MKVTPAAFATDLGLPTQAHLGQNNTMHGCINCSVQRYPASKLSERTWPLPSACALARSVTETDAPNTWSLPCACAPCTQRHRDGRREREISPQAAVSYGKEEETKELSNFKFGAQYTNILYYTSLASYQQSFSGVKLKIRADCSSHQRKSTLYTSCKHKNVFFPQTTSFSSFTQRVTSSTQQAV